MNDIVTVRIEHRNKNGDLQDKSEEFDVEVNNPYEINTRIKQFISCLLYTSPSPRDRG